MTKVNFTSKRGGSNPEEKYEYLSKIEPVREEFGEICHGYNEHEQMYVVDLVGSVLIEVNDMFPSEQYTWYHSFESFFLVPESMYSYMVLKYG